MVEFPDGITREAATEVLCRLDITRDHLVDALCRHTEVIEAHEWRPLADHVAGLMAMAYRQGAEDNESI